MHIIAHTVTRGVVDGGGGGRGGGVLTPALLKIGSFDPPRFENEVAKIRCFFSIFGVFWGRLTTLPTIRPPTQKSVATTLTVTRSRPAVPPQLTTRARAIRVTPTTEISRANCGNLFIFGNFLFGTIFRKWTRLFHKWERLFQKWERKATLAT